MKHKMILESLRDRAAEVMGWSRSDVDKFSLPALRAFIKGKDPELDLVIDEVISTGSHLFTKVKK